MYRIVSILLIIVGLWVVMGWEDFLIDTEVKFIFVVVSVDDDYVRCRQSLVMETSILSFFGADLPTIRANTDFFDSYVNYWWQSDIINPEYPLSLWTGQRYELSYGGEVELTHDYKHIWTSDLFWTVPPYVYTTLYEPANDRFLSRDIIYSRSDLINPLTPAVPSGMDSNLIDIAGVPYAWYQGAVGFNATLWTVYLQLPSVDITHYTHLQYADFFCYPGNPVDYDVSMFDILGAGDLQELVKVNPPAPWQTPQNNPLTHPLYAGWVYVQNISLPRSYVTHYKADIPAWGDSGGAGRRIIKRIEGATGGRKSGKIAELIMIGGLVGSLVAQGRIIVELPAQLALDGDGVLLGNEELYYG